VNKSKIVYLDFDGSKRNKVAIDDIVYLESNKQYGADSNNKRIYFADRAPETLIDFSFSKMEEKGLLKTQFIQSHRSFRVNANHILSYDNCNHEIKVKVFKSLGKFETKNLPVSNNYRKLVIKKS